MVIDWEDRIAAYPQTTKDIYRIGFEKLKILEERFNDKSPEWSVCQDSNKKG